MAEQQLLEAFSLIKRGDKKQAVSIISSVLKEDRQNALAWWLMAIVLDDPVKKRKAVEKVLALEPDHAGANKMLAKLSGNKPNVRTTIETIAAVEPSKTTQEIQHDWSKLEARHAKKKKSTNTSEDQAVKLATYLMIGFGLVLAVIIFLVVGLPLLQNASPSQPPEEVVLQLYERLAYGDFEAAREHVCPDIMDEFDAVVDTYAEALELLRQIASGETDAGNYEVNFDNMNIEIIEETANTATAQLSGQIVYYYENFDFEFPVNVDDLNSVPGTATTEQLRLENGVWCISDVSIN